MTILNLGSINWDRVLRVTHLPAPGETLHATSNSHGLGGKGLNQSVAILRSGGAVRHLGAVGAEDEAIRKALAQVGIADDLVVGVAGRETGSATIMVDDAGENSIVLDAGANAVIPDTAVEAAFDAMNTGDWLLFQNETGGAEQAVELARKKGLKVAYSAAPFLADRARDLLADVDLLAVNEVELAQLCVAIGGRDNLPEGLELLITKGKDGAEIVLEGEQLTVPAFPVDVVDTTGAGDVFLGVFLGAIDRQLPKLEALRHASAAAAIQVGRAGATAAIPDEKAIEQFLESR